MKYTRSSFLQVLAVIGSLMAAGSVISADNSDQKTVTKTATSTSSVSISVKTNNDESTVTYNNKEVWKGKVKKPVITVAKSVEGKDLAAAFEGKKVLWENVVGAGKQLEDERKKAAKQLKKLQG